MSLSFKALSLLALAAIGSTSPVSLVNRQVTCDPQNMEKGVSRYDCPKKNQPDANGHCSAPIPNIPSHPRGCHGYCEARITMFYGKEVPFEHGRCPEGTSCTLAESQSVTVTNAYSINVGFSAGTKRDLASRGDPASVLKATFDFGASYTYSESVTYGTTISYMKKLEANECGYWTFVPYMIESCGTLTTAIEETQTAGYSGGQTLSYCGKDLVDTPNWCNSTPHVDDNGHAVGNVILVRVDCTTNKPLPMDKQDPIYRENGVSTQPVEPVPVSTIDTIRAGLLAGIAGASG